MATRYIERAADHLSPAGDNAANVARIFVDSDSEEVKVYDRTASADRTLVSTDQTQTLSNKTLAATTTVVAPTPASITGATALTAALHANRISLLNAVAGGQVDLPAATGTGNRYRLQVIAALTSASWVFRTNVATGDRFTGGVFIDDTGDTGAVAAAAFFPAGASDEVLTMAFSATLGTIGTFVEFIDVATGIWAVEGYLGGSADPATPWGVATT